jgi:hypothetical protein
VKRDGLLPSGLDPNRRQTVQLEAQMTTTRDSESSSSSLPSLSNYSTCVRREFVWTGATELDEQLSLGTISQQFKTAIMRHELTSGCVIRQITSSDREFSAHHQKCTSYRREEVILGLTVEDSAILTSLFPSIDEVCFVCREKVRPLPLVLFPTLTETPTENSDAMSTMSSESSRSFYTAVMSLTSSSVSYYSAQSSVTIEASEIPEASDSLGGISDEFELDTEEVQMQIRTLLTPGRSSLIITCQGCRKRKIKVGRGLTLA